MVGSIPSAGNWSTALHRRRRRRIDAPRQGNGRDRDRKHGEQPPERLVLGVEAAPQEAVELPAGPVALQHRGGDGMGELRLAHLGGPCDAESHGLPLEHRLDVGVERVLQPRCGSMGRVWIKPRSTQPLSVETGASSCLNSARSSCTLAADSGSISSSCEGNLDGIPVLLTP